MDKGYEIIRDMLLEQYGDLSYSELIKALRKDGFGPLVDVMENSPEIMKLVNDLSDELSSKRLGDSNTGIIPASFPEEPGIPVDFYGDIQFDQKACLEKCRGNCCKKRNYLMISIVDIFRILSSSVSEFLGIHSTRDLFEKNPPLLEIFYLEKYDFFLPYIRYLPLDADFETRPEEAKGSICPFLYPIKEVYALHKKELPEWSHNDAMGCILMNNKPSICRLSPLGKSRGLKTGRLTFEYKESIDDCPACNSNVKIKVSDYLSSVETHSEIKQEEQIHKIYMHMDATPLKPKERLRFHEIVKKIYNIDKLLFDYGLGTEHRPNMDQLIKIVFAAGKGDFSLYEQFIDKLKNIKKALNGVENENKKTPLNLGRYT